MKYDFVEKEEERVSEATARRWNGPSVGGGEGEVHALDQGVEVGRRSRNVLERGEGTVIGVAENEHAKLVGAVAETGREFVAEKALPAVGRRGGAGKLDAQARFDDAIVAGSPGGEAGGQRARMLGMLPREAVDGGGEGGGDEWGEIASASDDEIADERAPRNGKSGSVGLLVVEALKEFDGEEEGVAHNDDSLTKERKEAPVGREEGKVVIEISGGIHSERPTAEVRLKNAMAEAQAVN